MATLTTPPSAEELDSLTDAQLSELFAVEVAGWVRATPEWISDRRINKSVAWVAPGEVPYFHPDTFATSADAVLPYAGQYWESHKIQDGYGFKKHDEIGTILGAANAATFARAACIALIRAKRAEKGRA